LYYIGRRMKKFRDIFRSSDPLINYDTDVIVVGSGLSGLASAYRLAKEGLKVTIIEADNIIGGRTRSITLPEGELVSVGGTWCIADDMYVIGLSQEVGCEPFAPQLDTNIKGLETLIFHPYLMFKLWLLGREFSKDKPDYWNSFCAKRYDNLSLEDWLNQQDGFLSNDESRKGVGDWFLLLENQPTDLSKISTLFAAVMVYQRLSNITETGLIIPCSLRWEGGTGVFIDAIVKKLTETGLVKIINDSQVYTITQSKYKITITSEKEQVTAKYAIVSTSMLNVNLISFRPPLDIKYVKMNQSIQCWNDAAFNIILVFKRDWKPGLTILPSTDNFSLKGIFGAVMNLTMQKENDDGENRGIFRILVDPSRVEGLSKEQIQEQALEYLISFYPDEKEDIISLFLYMTDFDWINEKPLIPAVTYYYKPNGSLVKYGNYMKKKFGRVYFGGSERSLRGLHWMEGAVMRGNEVSAKILKKLGKIKSVQNYLEDLEDQYKKVISQVRYHDILNSFKEWLHNIFPFKNNHAVILSKTQNELILNEKPLYDGDTYRTSHLSKHEKDIYDKLMLKDQKDKLERGRKIKK
jgi:monoamine oxidase